MGKTYDMYVEEINNAKDDNELSNIYDEVNMIQDDFVNKSLKIKIAKRSDDLSNNIVNPTLSKPIKNDDEIKISKTLLKKTGVITIFGVAILATGIALGKKSSSDNISARNVPYESSTDIEVDEQSITEDAVAIDGTTVTIEARDEFLISAPGMDQYNWNIYYSMDEKYRNVYRFINAVGDKRTIQSLILDYKQMGENVEDIVEVFSITELAMNNLDIYNQYKDKLPDFDLLTDEQIAEAESSYSK